MSVADLLVIAVVAALFSFILWANVHHRRKEDGDTPSPAHERAHDRNDEGWPSDR